MRRRWMELLVVLVVVGSGMAWLDRPSPEPPPPRPDPSPRHVQFDEKVWLATWQGADEKRSAGRLDQAEAGFLEALEMARLAGLDHFRVDDSLRHLAGFYSNQGRHEEALAVLEEYRDLRVREFGPDHPSVAEVLAILGSHQDPGRAEELFQRALEIRTRALGPEHLKVADSLLLLSQLYVDTGRRAESEKLFDQALAIQEKQISSHEFLASVCDNRADYLESRGHDATAARARAQRHRETSAGSPLPFAASTPIQASAAGRVVPGGVNRAPIR